MKMKPYWIYCLLIIILSLGCQQPKPSEQFTQLPDKVDFNFHIKPILSDRCFSCHGPDQRSLKAELRLDLEEGALDKVLESGRHAFVPRNIRRSEAFQRIISKDPELQMPPPDAPLNLSEYEKALIAKWIEQGAVYKKHWAFIPPHKTQLPKVNAQAWVQNEIDYFILKILEAQGLAPQTIADKETLLRRLSLDLIGLPPSIAEIDCFLADKSANSYEKVVDRLLNSPHFGEKMALEWLDVARYADSNGYSQDGLRVMWPWRDWVIKAFNDNMPFDQFIAWQIAGDKMPKPSMEQRLATAFLRNHRLNGEGGIVDEEYRIEYAADRTETTATAFLGLTMQCARCHDHKFDPISQEEYYQFFGFFNQVHEMGKASNDGNSGPEVLLTNREVDERIAFLDQQIAKEQSRIDSLAEDISPEVYQQPKLDLTKKLLVDLSFEKVYGNKVVNQSRKKELYELRGEAKIVEDDDGGKAIKFSGYEIVNIDQEELGFDRADAFSISFRIKSFHGEKYMKVLNYLGSAAVSYPGYEVAIIHGYPSIRLVKSLPANLIEVRASKPIQRGEWLHLTFTYEGSGSASGIKIFVNGKKDTSVIVYDKLIQTFANNRSSMTIGGSHGYQTEIEGEGIMDDLKIYHRRLSEIEALAVYQNSEDGLSSLSQQALRQDYLLNHQAGFKHIEQNIQQLRKEKYQIQDSLISVMVMEDLPEARSTFVLSRGAYDAPEREVQPNTPRVLPAFAQASSLNRKGLANWLLSKKNPLTARVIVNRFWQVYFGKGLVRTPEDFGNQGALPTHPKLLDWLALDFMESGWDTKALQKRLVMSATYQQSSRLSEAARAADPENIFYARGASGRLQAELIRDCVLNASGLLVKKIGGPSVKPYQPKGLWSEKGEFSKLKNYVQDTGDDLYRRGLYTFWRRSSPLPSMSIFDAPNRDNCIVKRQETNTPLQALVMLNDPQYVEAARVLAEHLIQEENDNKSQQIILAYRRLTGLRPHAKVVDLLKELEERERRKFETFPKRAKQLVGVGEYPFDESLNMPEVAAMTMVCSTIMSFDETLVKR